MFDAHFHFNALPHESLGPLVAEARALGIEGGVVAGVWLEDTNQNLAWARDKAFCGSRGFAYLARGAKSDASGYGAELDRSGYSLFLAHGLHPIRIGERWLDDEGRMLKTRQRADFESFERLLETQGTWIWAIGETGFDLSRDALAHPAAQKLGKEGLASLQEESFHFCLDVAHGARLPVIVHTRNAWKRTIDLLSPYAKRGQKIKIHCYGGSAEELPKLADLGIGVSFGGVATWNNAEKVREAVRRCPESIFMLETDAPDLAPEKPDGHRPEMNTPAEICYIAMRLAEMRGVSAEKLWEISDANLATFLGVPAMFPQGR